MDELRASDLELLRRFSRVGDEKAFETLVARYANLVFGVALRKGVGRQGAEDVTQKVFAVLARKACKLRRKASLAGWLSRTAALEAAYLRRTESNRKRTMDNYQQSEAAPAAGIAKPSDADDAVWRAALPRLDEVIAELPPGDQEVILQRYYNGESFAAIALLMNKTEAAVQKQARRALDKLSKLLKRRGVVLPAAALAAGLGSELSGAAPAAAAPALAQGALTTAPALTGGAIITNTLSTMAYAKTKTALIVAAAAAIPAGLQWNKINQLESELDARPPVAASAGAQAAKIATLEQELGMLKEQLAAAEQPRPNPVTALGKGAAGADAPGAAAGGLAGLAEMFEDPAMRELMKSQMKAQVDLMFGEFIKDLGLDDTRRHEFEDLLLDRQMELAANGMKAMRADLSEDEKAAAREALELAQDESNENLKALLGDEAFAEFERYEDSTTERTELTAFKQSLARSGADELSFEQEEGLMAIMYEERKAYKFTDNFDPSGQTVPEWEPTPERIEAIADDYRGLQTRIAARAGEVLDENQIGVFVENQDSFMKMMEAGLKMSMQMLGGGAPE